MTLVDTRRGTARGKAAGAWPDPLGEAETVDHPDVRRGARPGALGAWLIGLVVASVAVGLGSATTGPLGSVTFAGFVVASVLATGFVRRGRSLRALVGTLPLICLSQFALGSAVEIARGGTKVTNKQIALTALETAVLHAPWMWAGMVLGLLIGIRRGMLRRIPKAKAKG